MQSYQCDVFNARLDKRARAAADIDEFALAQNDSA